MPTQFFSFNDVVQCRLKGRQWGEPFENIVHFRNKCGTVDSINLASGIRNFFLNQLMAIVSNQAHYYAIGMARVRPSPKGWEDTQPIVPIVGASNQPPMPNQMATLMRIQTPILTRRGKGRMYLPLPVTTNFTGFGWTVGANAQMVSIGNIIRNEFGVGGGTCLELGVWSRVMHDDNWVGMTSIGWDEYPCTMRSRRPAQT